MKNNKDTHTNMMDLLPNEMVIRIFEHFENLTDLLTLPKVSHRFNELSKLKCSRNHLIFKDNEMDAYSYEEFQRKTLAEINKCRDLKAVTISISLASNGYLNTSEYWRIIISMFKKTLNTMAEEEIEIDEDDFDVLRMQNDEYILSYSYLKKSAGDMSRVVQIAPSAIINIYAKETPKLFQTAIEKYTDTLSIVTYVGKRTNLTLANLNALGKCKKLRKVNLIANLVVSEEVPETFESIQAKEIILEGNFHCPHLSDLFFSETVERFSVSYSTIAGFKNELLTKCTKLLFLSIKTESEREDMQNDQVIQSFIELVDTLKHHKVLEKVDISYLNLDVKNSYLEALSVWRNLTRGSGINVEISPLPRCPSIQIIFKMPHFVSWNIQM